VQRFEIPPSSARDVRRNERQACLHRSVDKADSRIDDSYDRKQPEQQVHSLREFVIREL
jgi:hypothetical protein